MKNLTKLFSFFTLLIGQAVTNQAFAHTDHALGDGAFHGFYHAVFWLVFAATALKGFMYFQKKKILTKNTKLKVK